MENYRRWFGYDWFKLVVGLILVALFLSQVIRPAQAVPVTGAALPAYPTAAGVTLTYDAASQSLMNPQGVPVYTLNASKTAWQPVIPAGLQASLPTGFQLVQDPTAGWVIHDPSGKLLYTWNPQTLQWAAAPTALTTGQPTAPSSTPLSAAAATAQAPAATTAPTMQAPTTAHATVMATEAPATAAATVPAIVLPATVLPATTVPTSQAPAMTAAPTLQAPTTAATAGATVLAAAPTATALPTMQAPTTAAATVPAAVSTATALPTGTPTQAAPATPTQMGTPTVVPGSGAATQTPVPGLAPAPTSVPGCKAPVPSRLVAGKNAKVLLDLNLRSAPAIGNNIIAVDPAGNVVAVLQGPVCVPYLNSAYLWWQVKNPAGKIGWSAENLLIGHRYYLEPIP